MLTSSEACERNKGPILTVLQQHLAASRAVLEVGSGTGQHAVHFATHLQQLRWQPTEVAALLPELAARLRLEGPPNLAAALSLDVRDEPWKVPPSDAVFSANTLHIMAWEQVQDFFRGVGGVLRTGGVLCVYGPFRYRGAYTSQSNAHFDEFLRARDPASGIRDFEAVAELARAQQLTLAADHDMPANNRTLVWQRAPARAP